MKDRNRTPLLGVSLLPTVADLPTTLRLARIADEAGLDLLAVQDHPYNPGYLDTIVLIDRLLAVTERVRVFPDVANVPLRGAAMLAKAASTLDILSNGRFELGLGAGAMWPAIHAYGGPALMPREAVDAFEEAAEVIRGALSGARGLRLGGQHHGLYGAHGGPEPPHSNGLWISASGPGMQGLIGRAGDGWVAPLPAYMSEDQVFSAQRHIDSAAQAAGRDPRDILRIRQLAGGVAECRDRGDSDHAIIASADRWVEILRDQIDRLHINAVIFWLRDYSERQLRMFVDQVAPAFR